MQVSSPQESPFLGCGVLSPPTHPHTPQSWLERCRKKELGLGYLGPLD